ncbi:TcaA second domain-containing protein [Salisediminibacterium beveridgei]|uniref:Zinc-ribbon domain-containing protein n=1 Tax=Salisediminibacterium beveridgei TaxID=632773 RepID=A0A1D7QRU1_9BACI|nr:hypothetical protein [Salisediminibacterium beveridgei]AOM81724.1 hypothetical protein BBEV_0330 [Salisediminibacterium beveridgei]
MKFCSQCGKQKDPKHRVCIHCGAKVPDVNQGNEGPPKEREAKADSENPGNSAPKLPMSKKQKYILTAVLVITAASGSFYYIGSSQSDPMGVVESFITGLDEGDTEKVRNTLVTASDYEEVSLKQAELFMEYIDQGPYLLEEIAYQLAESVEDIQEPDEVEAFVGSEEGPVDLEITGSKWLFFNAYAITMKPEDFVIHFAGDAEIRVDDEEVEWERLDRQRVSLGEYDFDEYDVTIHKSTVFDELKQTAAVDHNSRNIQSFDFDTGELMVTSALHEIELIHNGDETGVMIEGEGSIGPVRMDDSVMIGAKAETVFGDHLADEQSIDSGLVEFQFTPDDETAESAMSDIADLYKDEGYLEFARETSEIEVIDTVGFSTEDMKLMEHTNGDWEIAVPFYEQWVTGEAGSEDDLESNEPDVFELKLSYSSSTDEWGIAERNAIADAVSSPEEWETVEYDSESKVKELIDALDLSVTGEDPEDLEEQLEFMINDYHEHHVAAINGESIDDVTAFIDEDADDYEQSVQDYIDYARQEGITQEFNGSDLISYEEQEGDLLEIITVDRYYIHTDNGDTTHLTEFESTYLVSDGEEGLSLINLESTDEQWSEEQ